MPKKKAERFARAGGSYELDDAAKEQERAWVHTHDPANELVFDPGPQHRFDNPGAWIMLTRALPPLPGGVDKYLTVGRIFWAEHDAGADDAGFLPDGTYKIKISSPWSDVWLWPYEYMTIAPDTLVSLWADEELIFHAGNLSLTELNATVFYCRSRGLGLADAAVLALGTLSGNIGWFEPQPELARAMEGMEERVHRWDPTKSPRTIKSPMTVEIVIK